MTAVGRFSTRPLYLQVKDMLIQRIAAVPGSRERRSPTRLSCRASLASASARCAKPWTRWKSERLISRRQGRGTFVIDQTSNEHAVRFSNIRDPDGIRIAGETESCTITAAVANETEVPLAAASQWRAGVPLTSRAHAQQCATDGRGFDRAAGAVSRPRARRAMSRRASSCSPIATACCWGGPRRKSGVAAAKGESPAPSRFAEGTPVADARLRRVCHRRTADRMACGALPPARQPLLRRDELSGR